MKTINRMEFERLNKALYALEDLLGCMGVTEFSLSAKNHKMQLDTNADNIDTELLNSFCINISQIHMAKFGNNKAHYGNT